MEKNYTAPEAQSIVEPEQMISKIPGWIKKPILYSAAIYLAINISGCLMVGNHRHEGLSKSEIEQKVDNYGKEGILFKFVLDDLSKPGRELGYLIYKNTYGKQEK